MADRRNPHRIGSLEHLLTPERDPDERPRTRAHPTPIPDAFAEYAMVYNEHWPGRQASFLRWSSLQWRAVNPWLNQCADRLNEMVGTVLVEDYRAVTAQLVLRWIVRHWRAFVNHIRLRYALPVPEAIYN